MPGTPSYSVEPGYFREACANHHRDRHRRPDQLGRHRHPDRVETMPPEDLECMMSVNLMGTLHTMQAVLPSMRAADAGSIVNIASLAGRRGMPPLCAYGATKSAVARNSNWRQ
jgi:NADP-dependent 3-hydroxy acid dehydrogenase YdfG